MPTSDLFDLRRLKDVKFIVLDFDGVMTNGYVYTDSLGNETLRTSKRDSLGIFMLKRIGVWVIVITSDISQIASARCRKLRIPCYDSVGLGNGKLEILKERMKSEGFSRRDTMYVGDDLNDLEAMKHAGIRVTVADGCPEIKEIADIITKAKGGEHAVREICDLVLEIKGIDREKLLHQ